MRIGRIKDLHDLATKIFGARLNALDERIAKLEAAIAQLQERTGNIVVVESVPVKELKSVEEESK